MEGGRYKQIEFQLVLYIHRLLDIGIRRLLDIGVEGPSTILKSRTLSTEPWSLHSSR